MQQSKWAGWAASIMVALFVVLMLVAGIAYIAL